MKPLLAVLLIASLALAMAGCMAQEDSPEGEQIKSYRDIPGVTAEEIAAIEALKASREGFSYGQMQGTEAFALPNGAYAGFAATLCGHLSELFGIEFAPELYNWGDLKRGLEDRRIDFTGDLTPTAERMQAYSMSYPITERPQRIFTRADSDRILTEKDINGLKIGFLKDSADAEIVRKGYPELVFKAVEVENVALAARLLETGEIDAFVSGGASDPLFDSDGLIRSREFFPMVYSPVSLATANPELEPVITVLNKYLIAGGIDRLNEFYQKDKAEYARYTLEQSLTGEERAYIETLAARGGGVMVALESDNYPVSFYNQSEKEFQGIAVDVLAEISKLTGIAFKTVNGRDATWSEILEMLRAGEASMVSQLLHSGGRENDYLWTDTPYASAQYALLSKSDYPNLAVYQVVRATVGVVNRTAYEDKYNEWFPDNGNTVLYDTHDESLDALESGEIDLLMSSDYILLTQLNYREKSGYKVNIYFDVPMESYFGFNRDEAILCSIINKAQAYVNTDSITSGWTSRVFDYSRKYAAQFAGLLSVFVAILLLALLLVMYLWLRNKLFRKDLERKNATLSTIYDSIPDLVYCKDVDGKYVSCNMSFEKLVGRKESDIIGMNDRQLFWADEEMVLRFSESDREVMRKNTTITTEELVVFPDSTQRLFEAIKTPLIQDGRIIGVLGISRDIQEHKDAEEAARAASKAKSAFLAHMSHEIRTPMNAVSGMVELILREEIPPSIYEYIMSIRHASANLLTIINEILDFSKIEAGRMKLLSEEYSLASLINDVLVIMRIKVREKPILFTANVGCEIPNRLIGDSTRLRQIFLNVLGNAVNYTDEGFVSLTITGAVNGDTVVLTVEVSDSGVGIREEEIERLFGNFVRIDNVRNIPGTGLGLAITKSLCQAMDGDISVRSEYGAGSTFTITIPQKIGAPDEKFAAVPGADGMRVLLCETRPLYADSILRSFDDLGVRCTLVTGWPELQEELKRDSYSFLFIPSLLFESAGQAIEELSADIKLVLLMEVGETLAVHNVRTTPMPVHTATLAGILNNAEESVLYHERAGEKICFIAPTARVLLVDDLVTNLKVAEGLLAPYQMRTDLCKSGAEAVELAGKNQYDVIFMDHMMPEMDGIEAVRRIRVMEAERDCYQNVPIIALTANAVSGAKEKFLQKGMDDFLAKPIDVAKLNRLLEKWIPKEKKETYRAVEADPPTETADRAPLHIEGIDVPAGIAMTGGRIDHYLKMLTIFYLDGSDKRDRIRDCVEQNEIRLYTTYLHAIKSAAASLGAEALSNLARNLELAGEREDIPYIRENTERFLEELEALLQNLHAALLENQSAGEQPEGDDPEFLRGELLKLREALDDRVAEEVDDHMRALERVKWSPQTGELFQRVSRDVFLFNYDDAALLVSELLLEYE